MTHGLHHARLPCPSLSLGVYSNSCPWSQWCHPDISSSVGPFSSRLQSFPPSGSFQMSQFFTSACNKQGDNIQLWCTPFPIWNQSVVPCPVLTGASWPAHRFIRRQVRWSGIPNSWKNFPQVVVIYTVKGFGIVNKAEVDVFSGTLLLFRDPTDVGNLISGSSAFSKSRLNIWKFTFHILLKPGLENFKH